MPYVGRYRGMRRTGALRTALRTRYMHGRMRRASNIYWAIRYRNGLPYRRY